MTAIPLLWSVGVCTFQEGGRDSHGKPIQSWSDPVYVKVYGWSEPTLEEAAVLFHDREIVDLRVLVPAGFTVGSMDRVVVEGDSYDVVGKSDFTHGPFGYQPGGVVNLRRATG